MSKPGQFKKGQDPRRNIEGRPVGSKNFTTDFDEVVEEIAKTNKITISEARKILLKVAFTQAKGGNYNFWKEIIDRYYGKMSENIDLSSGGKPIQQLYAGKSRDTLSGHISDSKDILIDEKN